MKDIIKQLAYLVDLEPVKGSETRKKRPCLILQSNILNKSSKTFVVAPILPDHKDWPFVVNVFPTMLNGLDKNRHINIKQLRSIDRSRIANKQGVLEDSYNQEIKSRLDIIFKI